MPKRRRRLWFWLLPTVIVVIMWAGLWFLVAGAVDVGLSGWRERQARSGRIYDCGARSIVGFPFNIELRCTNLTVELRKNAFPLVLKGAGFLVARTVEHARRAK
jgi:hypothetical protein